MRAPCSTIAAATSSSSAEAVLVPRRRCGCEHLDDPRTDPALRERSLRDVRRANTLLGGARAVVRELGRIWPSLSGAEASMLDVGTGLGATPARARLAA